MGISDRTCDMGGSMVTSAGGQQMRECPCVDVSRTVRSAIVVCIHIKVGHGDHPQWFIKQCSEKEDVCTVVLHVDVFIFVGM